MAVIETWLEQDIKEPVQVKHLCGSFFSHNGNANRIGVKVFDNGSPVTLSGTVSGYAVLPDGTTVPCTGSLSGNQASVLLPAAAYVPGNICVTIMLTSGSTITTLAALTGSVVMARTDTQVDPGSVVTDWTNTINAALQTVEGYTGNIIATPYASLTYPVPLGKYCIYNDLLYRCVSPIASSESWTASHWVQVKLADDVSDLKSAINVERSTRISEDFLKVNKPLSNPNGTAGQLLKTLGNGQTEWVNEAQPTDEQTAEAISAWLDRHPEATTTVQDGSLTPQKFQSDLYDAFNSGINDSIDLDYLATIHSRYYNATYGINEPTEPEGIACIGDGKVVTFLASADSDSGFPQQNSPTLLTEFQITPQRTTSYIIRQKTLTGLTHANSAGYNPLTSEIYVTPRGYDNSGTTVNQHEIVIIDYATLEIKETVTIDMSGTGQTFIDTISYDKVKNKLYGFTGNELFEIDLENEEAHTVFVTSEPYNHTGLEYMQGRQGLAVIDDLCYVSFASPNVLVIYSISQQKRLKTLNYPDCDGYGHVVAYTQDIDYDPLTFDFYLNAFHAIDIVGNGAEYPYNRACYVFLFNPIKGAVESLRQDWVSSRELGNIIYVNKSTTRVYQKGSSACPYKTISEAIIASRYGSTNGFLISVANGGTYDETLYIQSMNVAFNGTFTVNGLRLQESIVRFTNEIIVTGTRQTTYTIGVIGTTLDFNNITAYQNGNAKIYYSSYGKAKGLMLKPYGSGSGNGVHLLFSTLDAFIPSTDTNKNWYIDWSSFVRRPPNNLNLTVVSRANIHIDMTNVSSCSITNFDGYFTANVKIVVGNKTVYARSQQTKKGDSNATGCDINVWFGVIRITFDKNMNITSIKAEYCDPNICQSASGSGFPITLKDGTTQVDVTLDALKLE